MNYLSDLDLQDILRFMRLGTADSRGGFLLWRERFPFDSQAKAQALYDRYQGMALRLNTGKLLQVRMVPTGGTWEVVLTHDDRCVSVIEKVPNSGEWSAIYAPDPIVEPPQGAVLVEKTPEVYRAIMHCWGLART